MRNRQASVVFVLITLFIDMLGMGLVIPILPRLVQSLLGGAIGEASFVFGLLVVDLLGHAVLLRARSWARCRTASDGGR